MDKPTLHLIGHKLRRAFKAPDDLPYPMQMALKALARRPVREGDNDNQRDDRRPTNCSCDKSEQL